MKVIVSYQKLFIKKTMKYLVTVITLFFAVANGKAISKCEYPKVLLTSGSCDGTCDNPTPPCVFTKILRERCGCPPGKVVDESGVCVPVYMCEMRPGLPTQCEVESIFNGDIKCDSEGNFEKKQKKDNKFVCVVPETGNSIPGKIASESDALDCEDYTRCQTEWISDDTWNLNEPYLMDGPSTYCRSDGNYESLQCYSFTSNCRCVVPETGTTIPGTEFIFPGFNCNEDLTPCQQKFVDIMALNQIDPENSFMDLPECSLIDGNYLEKSCDETGSCQCQNRITGEKYPGEAKDMNCLALTTCQLQYMADPPLPEPFPCDENGKFATPRCNGGSCICIDPNTGEQVDEIPSEKDSNAPINCPIIPPLPEEIPFWGGLIPVMNTKE